MKRPTSLCFVSAQGHDGHFLAFLVIEFRNRVVTTFRSQWEWSLCDPVQLLEANQIYSVIRHADGRRTAVSTSDLAPHPQDSCPVSREDASGGAHNDCNDDVDSVRLLTETDFSVPEAGQDEPAQSANHYSPVPLRRIDQSTASPWWLRRMRRYPLKLYRGRLWELTYYLRRFVLSFSIVPQTVCASIWSLVSRSYQI